MNGTEPEARERPPERSVWQRGLRSKILDGLLPALVLYLLLMVILFGLKPIQVYFGGPGLMVYTLGLLGVAMFSLQRSLIGSLSESTRAWYGMAAGVLAWAVVQISAMLEATRDDGLRGTILLILVGLVGTLLWRQSLPLGARFFWITFCANWAGSEILGWMQQGAAWSPAFLLFGRATGISAGAASSIVLLWMLSYSQRRIQRIWASLAIVMLAVFAVYTLQGNF